MENANKSPFVPKRTPKTTKIELTDLRAITRNSDRVRGVVILKSRLSEPITWLVFGEGNLEKGHWDDFTTHTLKVRMTAGVTDREGDSAYAAQLPLIGMSNHEVIDGIILARGWIDPNRSSDFRVPRPGYDPTKLTLARVNQRESDPTIVVPDEYWLPPFDMPLFKAVRGLPVELRFGTVEPGRGVALNWEG